MLKRLVIAFAVLFLFALPAADACVGKILRIGAVNSPDGLLLSEMLAIMINERTGSTVNVKLFNNTADLYDAVRAQQLDILVENTATAMKVLNKNANANPSTAYDIVKVSYENEKGLIWLKPMGPLGGNDHSGQSIAAPVLTVETLTNFPALPKVINKLAGILTDESYAKMTRSVNAGEKPKSVAREMLKSKKLI
jgi:osmoprotectant transport system substrate-binding protein